MIATISRNLHLNPSIPAAATTSIPSTRQLHSNKSKPVRSNITKPKPTTTTTPKSTPSTSTTSGRTGKFSKPKRIPSIKPNQRDNGFFTTKFKSYHNDDPSKGIRISEEIEVEQEQDLDDQIDTQIDLQIGNGNGNGEIKPFPRPKLKVNSFLKKKLDDDSSVKFNVSTVSDFENPFLNTALRKESLLEEKRRKSRNYVSVVIDADNYWFNLDLVNQGREGGFKAINLLRSKISSHLGIPDTKEEQNLDLRVYCFANLRGLATTFSRRGYVEDKACFAQFVSQRTGVSLSGSHCFFSDTGPSQESADSKVRAWLVDSLLDQDCQHVYLGGLDDLSYSNDLVGLQRLNMLDRVSLLNIPPLAKKLMNPITKQMFLERKVDWDTSEIFVTSQSYDTKENRSSKHFEVMPCIYYHLSEDGCVKSNSACSYSHEPLSPEELERLRSKIKHRICPYILRREICPKGRNCIFHHPS